MRTVKPEVRVLGVDDAAFTFDDEQTWLIGTVYRGGDYLEGVLRRDVTVDGMDVTDELLDMVQNSRHADQVQVAILDGITFAGLNIADIHRLAEEGDIGVIAVSRTEPDPERMEGGLQHVDRADERRQLIAETGPPHRFEQENGMIYFQHAGIDEEQARNVLRIACVRSLVPEPVRAAHLIAGALKNGESKP